MAETEEVKMDKMKKKADRPVEWNYKKIRSNIRRTVFFKGIKPYLILLLVIFIFSFIGVISSNAQGLINRLDMEFGVGAVDPDNMHAIVDYIYNLKIIKALPAPVGDLAATILWGIVTSYSWILNLLGRNKAYVQRNLGEVFAFIMIFAFIYNIISDFIKKTFSVGTARGLMENRFQKSIRMRRILAPFGNNNLFHIIIVMTEYLVISFLWWLTIVGGIIKYYQYLFVPYILAENPKLSWKEARNLSMQMTKGYKMKMFITHLSYIYLVALSFIPFLDLLICLPIYYTTDVELYFTLRQRMDIDRSLLPETAFDQKAYVERIKDGEDPDSIKPEYLLPDFSLKNSDFDKADKYRLTDFIIMFFLFSFVGWLWEVSLHVVQDHAFINRGTMYGPWLPIYGAGGAFIIIFLCKYKGNKPKLFLLTMVLCGILEYLTSFVLEFFNNAEYWNYDDMFANLNGRVCLAGLIAFALGGFLGIYILGPLIKNLVDKIGRKWSVIICSVLVTAFVIDLICCIVFGPNAGEGIGQQLALAFSHVCG